MSAKGRYPSDLTDGQWALVEPLLSAAKPGGRPEAHPRREVVNAVLYLLRRAARGVRCRRTFRRGRRCTGTSLAGAMTARWTRSTTSCVARSGRPRDARPIPRCDHRRAVGQRVRTPFRLPRVATTRARNQRQKAPHRGRHDRPPVRRACRTVGLDAGAVVCSVRRRSRRRAAGRRFAPISSRISRSVLTLALAELGRC